MRVLVFTPHALVPCYYGAQRRILELLTSMRTLGAEVHLVGCGHLSPWSEEGIAWCTRNGLCNEVSVYQKRPSRLSRVVSRARRHVHRSRHRWSDRSQALQNLTPPPMRRWFDGLVEGGGFDRVVIHYAWYASLIDGLRKEGLPRSILESQDLLTVNVAMRLALDPLIGKGPAFNPGSMPDETLDLGFYDSPRFMPHASEFAALDRFDVTIAITDAEASAMRARVRRTRVLAVATPADVVVESGTQGPLALLPMGPHPFNLQGYAWFARKVLPLIRAECPDFELSVTGILYRGLTLAYEPNVRVLGFIKDTTEIWKLGRMLVNPVWGGTGQPIKTIEAMAAGLPPVILERFAGAAPVIHGLNGFVAKDAIEFASYCVKLWRDPLLCRKMGALAREAVQHDCSREKFATQLKRALDA